MPREIQKMAFAVLIFSEGFGFRMKFSGRYFVNFWGFIWISLYLFAWKFRKIFFTQSIVNHVLWNKRIFLHYDSAKFCNSWHDVIIVYWSMVHLSVKTFIYFSTIYDEMLGKTKIAQIVARLLGHFFGGLIITS